MKEIFNILKINYKYIILLLILTFISYSNVIRGEFVTADDFPGILNNPEVKNLWGSIATLRAVSIKNAVIYSIFGYNSSAYHFVGIIIHLINIILVFIFVKIAFNQNIAKIASIIFALHPVNTESVMWISGNPYAMNGFFTLLVLIFYSLYEVKQKIFYLVTSLIIFLILVVLDNGAWPLVTPFIILCLNQFVFSKKIDVKKSLIIIPFIIIAFLSAYFVLKNNYSNRVSELTSKYYFNPNEAPPLLNRLPFSLYIGLKNLIFPYELNIYPGEKMISSLERDFIYLISILFLFMISYLFFYHKLYFGLILAIIFSLGPVLSPIQVAWIMTERYLYVGSIFFALIISLLLIKLQKINNKYFDLTLGFIVIIFIFRIILRSEDWRTNKNLWISTLKFSPDSYRVYNNLGDVYIKEQNFQKAIENFEMSFKVYPLYADAMHNLGVVYIMLNDFENAKKYMEMAINTNPNLASAYEKMGVIYYETGQNEDAMKFTIKALQLDPKLQIANAIYFQLSSSQPSGDVAGTVVEK